MSESRKGSGQHPIVKELQEKLREAPRRIAEGEAVVERLNLLKRKVASSKPPDPRREPSDERNDEDDPTEEVVIIPPSQKLPPKKSEP